MDKVTEQCPFDPHLKPERLSDAEIRVQVAMEIGVTHWGSPIQGKATSARVARSSLA
jgi:hypothetical protein